MSLTLRLENLVKKFGDPDICCGSFCEFSRGGFFAENSSRCPDLVQLTARLLVKSLNNHAQANVLSSLALAVQGLEILTRNGTKEKREKKRKEKGHQDKR